MLQEPLSYPEFEDQLLMALAEIPENETDPKKLAAMHNLVHKEGWIAAACDDLAVRGLIKVNTTFKHQQSGRDDSYRVVITGAGLRAVMGLKQKPSVLSNEPEFESAHPKRGRRAKYNWEEAYDEVWGQIYRGDVNPKSVGDVEQVFKDFFAQKYGDHPEHSSIYPYAKRIWDQIQKP